jgi:hypothetical protein
MGVSRRAFLGTLAAGSAIAADIGKNKGIPTRILGRTDARVTILAFGTGSRFLMFDDDQAVEVLNHALDLGITYVDTAYGYGNGKSETRVGMVMKSRRKEVWLATKLNVRGGDEAMSQFEGCLKRLQTDHVDLVHIHQLQGEDDLAKVEAPDGVLKTLYKLRDQKMTRAIGVTCHGFPATLKLALERHDFDCTQMALNAALVGMESKGGFHPKPLEQSFESLALPVARKKNLGVIAMKVFAQEALNDKASPEKLVGYPLSLAGVTATVIGHKTPEQLEHNVEIAKAYKPMPPAEMKSLSSELSGKYKASLDRFFSDHVDA